jgi:HEPN domain-containing protein
MGYDILTANEWGFCEAKPHISTRYPHSFASGAPTDFYTKQEAQAAIHHAEEIIEFCRDQIG